MPYQMILQNINHLQKFNNLLGELQREKNISTSSRSYLHKNTNRKDHRLITANT